MISVWMEEWPENVCGGGGRICFLITFRNERRVQTIIKTPSKDLEKEPIECKMSAEGQKDNTERGKEKKTPMDMYGESDGKAE